MFLLCKSKCLREEDKRTTTTTRTTTCYKERKKRKRGGEGEGDEEQQEGEEVGEEEEQEKSRKKKKKRGEEEKKIEEEEEEEVLYTEQRTCSDKHCLHIIEEKFCQGELISKQQPEDSTVPKSHLRFFHLISFLSHPQIILAFQPASIVSSQL